MRICLVGGSGFIGTHLARASLARGDDVVIYDIVRSEAFPARWTAGDVRDLAALRSAVAGADCVVQLAAAHRDDVKPASAYREINVAGAATLAAAMRAEAVSRLLFVSTVAVYGSMHDCPDETITPNPETPYGRSKLEAEHVFRDWQRERTDVRSLSILRPTVVFGEGNRGNVHTLIEQIRQRRFAMIGDGGNQKSLAYIDNLVAFMLTRMTTPAGEWTINFVDKPDLNMREFVRSVYRALDRDPESMPRIPYWLAMCIGYGFDVVSALSRRGFPINSSRVRKFCASTRFDDAALRALGYQPAVDLHTGLARTVAAARHTGS